MLLKFAQLVFLILPLAFAVLGLIIAERFEWREFLAPFAVVVSFYGAFTYLLVFGKKGNWQEQFVGWLRSRVLNRLMVLLVLNVALTTLLAVEVVVLMRGPIVELRGQVLIENRPITNSALIRMIGLPNTWHSDSNGIFEIQVADERQAEFTLIAEYNDLSGKQTVRRGGHRGFEIALTVEAITPAPERTSKNVAVFGKHTIPGPRRNRPILQPALVSDNVIVFSAARDDQQAFELSQVRHGAFTFFFLEAMSVRALREPYEVLDYVGTRVRQATSSQQYPMVMVEGNVNEVLPLRDGRFDNPENFFSVSVGISVYLDSSLPSPDFATRDAVAIYSWLLDAGASPTNASVLLDAQATKATIVESLERMIERVGGGSVVFIYYSGVGAVEEDFDGDEPDGLDEYITCFDSFSSNLSETAISGDFLNSVLRRLSSKVNRVIVVLDTSFWVPATR